MEMLSSVLLMTIPGLALFYAGMVRKNVEYSFTKLCYLCTCDRCLLLVTVQHLPQVLPLFRWFQPCLFRWYDLDKVQGLISVSHVVHNSRVVSHVSNDFVIITPALITGASAERMRFSALIVFMALWSICLCTRRALGVGTMVGQPRWAHQICRRYSCTY